MPDSCNSHGIYVIVYLLFVLPGHNLDKDLKIDIGIGPIKVTGSLFVPIQWIKNHKNTTALTMILLLFLVLIIYISIPKVIVTI